MRRCTEAERWRQRRKDADAAAAADDGEANSKRHDAVMQLCRRQYKRLFYRQDGTAEDGGQIASGRAALKAA